MKLSVKAKFLLALAILGINASNAQLSFDQLMSNGVRADEKGQYDEAIINLNLAVDSKPENDMA
jgi:hypothetical protein